MLAAKPIADLFLKRVRCRADHVAQTADYVCNLERVLDLVAGVLPTPGFAREYAELIVDRAATPREVPGVDGSVVIARDAADNVAVLWRHRDRWDLIVSLTPAFGAPVDCRGLGLIRDDGDDATLVSPGAQA